MTLHQEILWDEIIDIWYGIYIIINAHWYFKESSRFTNSLETMIKFERGWQFVVARLSCICIFKCFNTKLSRRYCFHYEAVPITFQPVKQSCFRFSSNSFRFCVKKNLDFLLVKAISKICGDWSREIKSFVSLVRLYRQRYSHHRTSNSCSRALISSKQSSAPNPTVL